MKLAAQNYRRIKNVKIFFHENHLKFEMKRTKEKSQYPSKFKERIINENYTLARLWEQLAHLLALSLEKQDLKILQNDKKTKYPLKFNEENAKYFAWKIEL